VGCRAQGSGFRVWGLPERVDVDVFKAHRLVYHSTLGLRVIKKKKKETGRSRCGRRA